MEIWRFFDSKIEFSIEVPTTNFTALILRTQNGAIKNFISPFENNCILSDKSLHKKPIADSKINQ